MSLQLQVGGGGPPPGGVIIGPSVGYGPGSDMGTVTTIATNNMQSTQANTIPTQQPVSGLSKKGTRGSKNPIAGVKGG